MSKRDNNSAASAALGRLPPGELGHRLRGQARREAESVADGARPRLEVRTAERQVPLECRPVVLVGSRLCSSQRRRGPLEGCLRPGDAGSPRQVAGERLSLDHLALLGKVANGRVRGDKRDSSGVGLIESGENSQQCRLPDAVRTDDAEARLGPDGEVNPFQNGLRATVLRNASGGERGGGIARERTSCGGVCAGVAGVASVRHFNPQRIVG